MRRKAKVDDNQKSVVASLRQIPHLSVAVMSAVGQGFPDLIIGYKNINLLIELKDENKTASRRKLTAAQKIFHEEWNGQIYVCKNFEEILSVLFMIT